VRRIGVLMAYDESDPEAKRWLSAFMRALTELATAALHRETRTIPIVFVPVADPVGSGFVAGLPRPGGNITGFISYEASLAGKWLQLGKRHVSGASGRPSVRPTRRLPSLLVRRTRGLACLH
jgi:hypothetical protein